MNKIWIYGCSFSEPHNLEIEVINNKPCISPLWDTNNPRQRILRTDYWGTHLARKLNYECVTRSLAGRGLNAIIYEIEQDVTFWDKDKDIIIISPSFLGRVTFMELGGQESDLSKYPEILLKMKDLDDIFNYNKHRWQLTIQNYQHIGYNVYTWLVDNVEPSNVKNIITAPDGSVNWKHWMDKHYEYWLSKPGEYNPYVEKVLPGGDWHFNKDGHLAVAERMYEIIKTNL